MSNSTPQIEADKRLQNYENKKREFSEKTSETLRSLAFAEIALFWMLFKEFDFREKCIYFGLLFLIFYFVADTLQYIIGMLSYKYLCKRTKSHIAKKQFSKDVINNDSINLVSNTFFYIKLALMIISSIILSIAIYKAYPALLKQK